MTHKKVFTEVRFFKNIEQSFTNIIVHELKPIDLNTNDILFSQNDYINDIYYIVEG